MNHFDRILKAKAAEEQSEIPASVKDKIEKTLADLPEKKAKPASVRVLPKAAAAAACFIFIVFFLVSQYKCDLCTCFGATPRYRRPCAGRHHSQLFLCGRVPRIGCGRTAGRY